LIFKPIKLKGEHILNIIFIGDISGRPGREAIFDHIYNLREKYNVDVCIANCENAAGGFGVNRDIIEELTRAGVDVFTTGNHVWSKKEIINLLNDDYNLLRPHNLPPSDPGTGVLVYTTKKGEKIAVINLLGRLYMNVPASNPFFAADEILNSLSSDIKNIIVDFHAEATSEKKALGYYLDGRVSGVFGTHTHVQTADECILPNKTAYITDVGMSGAVNSILGINKDFAISKFISSVPSKIEIATGERCINAVFVKTDFDGKAQDIVRIRQ